MFFFLDMIKVSSRVRLPLKVSRGTDIQRIELAENLLLNFVNRIEPEFNKRKELSLNRVQAVLRESLPAKGISVETIQSVEGYGNNFLISQDEFGKLDTFAIELVTNDNGKLGLQHRNSLYHEASHFFDAICRPKTTSRILLLDDSATQEFTNFYHRNFYTKRRMKNKTLSDKLSQFLGKYQDEDKINLLQHLRYEMQGEYNAYSRSNRLAPEVNHFENYHFPKKIELVTMKLRELLQELRGAN